MSLLKELGGHPEYQRLLNVAREQRPVIPQWDSINDNTEAWKEASAMQKGFDLAMVIFTPK